ncbi:Isotrichodermin C-15 hydroxylase [Fusarium sp. NRRL 52700]|nr:Isotrichodermin C-15 hydroxylase [Fusarium sp. NRRL 52700]
MDRNNRNARYPEPDDDEEWPFGMSHWFVPFFLFLMYIGIADYLNTSYDSVCMERSPLLFHRFNEWAPKLNDIRIDIQNITQELNDRETLRIINAVNLPVDIATSLRKENQQLKQALGYKFDDQRLLQIAKESVEHELPSYPENPLSREELLDIRAYVLLARLQELQEPRKEIWEKISGQFRQDLSKFTHNICHASTQLEDLARQAKTFNKPTLRQLQEVNVATYVLCQESRSDARRLDELVDQPGIRLSLVETVIDRASGLSRDIFATKPGMTGLWKYWMAKGAMTEEELDRYEAERMMIGKSVVNMLEGGIVLPESTSW